MCIQAYRRRGNGKQPVPQLRLVEAVWRVSWNVSKAGCLTHGTIDTDGSMALNLREEFERRRVSYQKELQLEFFARYTIDSTYQYKVKNGESLWVLALRKFKVPVWLLRQHNPDVNFNRIRPGQEIIVPVLVEVDNGVVSA